MPWVNELLDRFGTAHFFMTLDLTKCYWHIPLSPEFPLCTDFTNSTHFYLAFSKKGVDYISQKLSEWEMPGLSSEVGIWWGVAQLQGRGGAVNSEGPGSFPSFSSSIVSTKAAKVKRLHLL